MPPIARFSLARRGATRVLAAVAAAAWLVGCTTLAPETAEAEVAQRAQQRWDALIGGDFIKAWGFTQPAYRAVVKAQDYYTQFGRGGKWSAAKVQQVKCESARCNVTVDLSAQLFVPGFRNQPSTGAISEVWVREDGQWWFYQAL